MSVDITKTSVGDKIEETRSYYGPSMALLRLAILPPLPCFRLSGHGRPQLCRPTLIIPTSPLSPILQIASISLRVCVHLCAYSIFVVFRDIDNE